MFETCRGSWFLINWIKKCIMLVLLYWYTVLWCTVNKTLSFTYKNWKISVYKAEAILKVLKLRLMYDCLLWRYTAVYILLSIYCCLYTAVYILLSIYCCLYTAVYILLSIYQSWQDLSVFRYCTHSNNPKTSYFNCSVITRWHNNKARNKNIEN
jgi:hypothetical protein